jgi:hypothetical protein
VKENHELMSQISNDVSEVLKNSDAHRFVDTLVLTKSRLNQARSLLTQEQFKIIAIRAADLAKVTGRYPPGGLPRYVEEGASAFNYANEG